MRVHQRRGGPQRRSGWAVSGLRIGATCVVVLAMVAACSGDGDERVLTTGTSAADDKDATTAVGPKAANTSRTQRTAPGVSTTQTGPGSAKRVPVIDVTQFPRELIAGSSPFVLSIKHDSDGAVTVASATPDSCSIAGASTLVPLAAGRCELSIAVSETAAFQPASVNARVAIKEASGVEQEITWASQPDRVQVGEEGVRATATSDAGLPVTLTASGSCTIDGEGLLTFPRWGRCDIVASAPGLAGFAPKNVQTGIDVEALANPLRWIGVPSSPVHDGAVFSAEAEAPTVEGVVGYRASGNCQLVTAPNQFRATGVGRCELIASSDGDARHVPAQVPLSVEITSLPAGTPMFTWAIPAGLHPNETAVVSITSDGPTPEVAVRTAGVCRLDGSTLRALAPGACVIVARSPASAGWEPKSEERSVNVAPANPQIEIRFQDSGSWSWFPGYGAPTPWQSVDRSGWSIERFNMSQFAVEVRDATGGLTGLTATPSTCSGPRAQPSNILGTCVLTLRHVANPAMESVDGWTLTIYTLRRTLRWDQPIVLGCASAVGSEISVQIDGIEDQFGQPAAGPWFVVDRTDQPWLGDWRSSPPLDGSSRSATFKAVVNEVPANKTAATSTFRVDAGGHNIDSHGPSSVVVSWCPP
ncbi:MAG: hypothetical protein AB7W59_05470 [Acidimicrobiia bacterium]